MNAEPEWVEDFLANLRRTANSGRVNVRLCCQLTCTYPMLVYRFRRTPEGERLRAEWDKAKEKARARRLLHSR